MVRRSSVVAGLAGALALVACGGGGGKSPAAPSTPPPVVERYAIGGTVTGLGAGAAVVLQDNGGDDLTVRANGPFLFPTAVDSGGPYAVTVKTQPPGLRCTVARGAGIATGPVTDVAVTCAATSFRVGGTAFGTGGPGLVLQDNGGDDLAVASDGGFTFPTRVAQGSAYAVTVKAAPAGRICTVSAGAGIVSGADVTDVLVTCATTGYRLGVTVGGLPSPGLVLQANAGDDLVVDADGAFTFSAPLAAGSPYAVTVKTQPAGGRCDVAAGTGSSLGADVSSVRVTCTRLSYHVGGTVSGLGAPGLGLVLRNAGGDDLAVDADGVFTFATPVPYGGTYAVTVATQPAGRYCLVDSGVGTVPAGDVSTVVVTCTTLTYAVAGTVTGVTGPGLVLRNDGTDDLPVDVDGVFTFATHLPAGAPYAVTVLTQPPGRECTIAGGAGTVPAADVNSVAVTCGPAHYAVAASVTGLTGAGLVLQDNGGDDLPVDASGLHTFATRLLGGAAYAVTVKTQPFGQLCGVTGGAGTVSGASVTVAVSCANAAFHVGGLVSGLVAAGLVLQDNGGDSLPVDADGAFTFVTPIPNRGSYAVTVSVQPSGQFCLVTGGSGAVAGGDVSTVRVNCGAGSFTVGGTVSGILRPGLVLQNDGGDDLHLDADGAFSFATPVAYGAAYAVTVLTQPPGARCAVAGGSGNAVATVTDVVVTCHGWADPAAVRTGGGNASSPVLAFDPSGDAVAVWIELDTTTSTTHVWSARYAGATATWGAATRIDSQAGSASAPDVAIDPFAGDVVAVWQQNDSGGTAHAWRNRAASGTWGAAERFDVSAFPVTSAPRIGASNIGDLLVVWTQRGVDGVHDNGFDNVGSVRFGVFFSQSPGWSAPVRVDTSDLGAASGPQVSYASGIGVAAWQQSDGTRSHVWSARWVNSARWTGINAPVAIDTGTADAIGIELSVGQDGTAYATWQQPDPADGAILRVWATRYGGSAWSEPAALETTATSMRFADVSADAVAPADGGPNAFAVWRVQGSPDVHAARYDRSGAAWSPATRLGGGASDPGAKLLSVAGSTTGDAVAVWQDGARIRASHFTFGQGWDGEVQVDTATATDAPIVRYDGAGNGLALWIQQTGGTWQLTSARFR